MKTRLSHLLSSAFLASAAIFASTAHAQGATEPLTIVSGDKTHALRVEIADTAEKRTAGLTNRTSLAADGGLVLDYRAVAGDADLNMKGIKIPLDMLFLDTDGTVLGIAVNARPESLRPISPGVPAAAVLEINGGQAIALGLKPGDKVKHKMFGNGG